MRRPLSLAIGSLSLSLVSTSACVPQPAETPSPVPTVVPLSKTADPKGPLVSDVELSAVGLDPEALDRSADPCEDFYQFACGNWIAKAQIPADRPMTSRSFVAITDRNEEALRKILEEAQTSPGNDKALQKIGAYYGACMNESAVEQQGLSGIKSQLDNIKKISDRTSLLNALTELHRQKVWALFSISEEQDFKDATQMLAQIDQSGLGLPDRDDYFREDDKSKTIRETYLGHVEKMLTLAGDGAADAKKGASDIMALETALAKASKTRVERRDPVGMYNKVDRRGLKNSTPLINWDAYFKALGFPDIQSINVTSVPFLEAINKLVDKTKPAVWRSYLKWQVIRATASALPKAFDDEAFRMEATLTGQKEQRPRWKRCVSATDAALGELLAEPFVRKYFAASSKEATERYVAEVTKAFGEELTKLDWMDDSTRAKAREKLEKMAYLIGYPKKWRTYEFSISPAAWTQNVIAGRTFDLRYNLGKVGKPVDRERWGMTPPTVNAYYRGTMNHMVFPAGILQPPFFSPSAHIPVNLGAMGMVVGHELTHGFDDKGSKFDADGNMKSFWTDDARKKFTDKTDCIVKQYAEYEVLPGLKLDGKLTLGENIADNAGVMLAFQAYRSLRKGAAEVLRASGFSEDQQFFLSVGQVWCVKMTDEIARQRVQKDTHSHPRFRVNGSLTNFPAFAEAFQCKTGSKMHPANVCTVW